VAKILKKSPAWVTEVSQIGELRPAIQKKIHTGEIGYTIARELIALKSEDEQDSALKELELPSSAGVTNAINCVPSAGRRTSPRAKRLVRVMLR